MTCLKQDRFKNHEVKHLSNLEAINSLSSITPWKQLQRAKYCSPSLSRSPLEVTKRVAQLRAAEFGPNLAIYVLWCLFLQQRLSHGRSPARPGAVPLPSSAAARAQGPESHSSLSLYQYTNKTAELFLAHAEQLGLRYEVCKNKPLGIFIKTCLIRFTKIYHKLPKGKSLNF